MKKTSFKNFFGGTVADFSRCEIPDRNPDYVSFSGSAYWNKGNKVIRQSDHWGNLISSRWLLEGKESKIFTCAYCYYENFRPIKNIDFSKDWEILHQDDFLF